MSSIGNDRSKGGIFLFLAADLELGDIFLGRLDTGIIDPPLTISSMKAAAKVDGQFE
jgi:hypothetical protein